jgi:amino acid adenylation domain-containing protein
MPAGSTERFDTLPRLLAHRALDNPGMRVLVYLEDGIHEKSSLTYAELHGRAVAIAATLLERAEAGSRALLLFPPGLEFVTAFFGCLYAGMIAVPAYPPKHNQKATRLLSIFDDAAPGLILGTQSSVAGLREEANAYERFTGAQCVATDAIALAIDPTDLPATARASDIAFLQYTSGSTSTPKGVMVTHGNLIANSEYIKRAFRLSAGDTTSVSWLPCYHDMGLIDGILQPVYTGFTGYLMPSNAFFQQPVRWLEAIAKLRATHCGGPDFAYGLCVSKTTPQQRDALDLSSWMSAYNGAEPVRAATLELFCEAFAASGFRKSAFYPCYGMAETTLMVSGGAVEEVPAESMLEVSAFEAGLARDAESVDVKSIRLVSSGRVHGETQVLIVDPANCERCAEDRVGEIWVRGPSVTAGYWGKPEISEATFAAFLRPSGEGPYLRTGDLGFLRAGELYVTGRLKDVIILRGRNHYPQDIELTAEQSHPGLRRSCNAAFTIEREGQERLVILQEVQRIQVRRLDPQIASSIRRAVALEHDIQPYAVVLLAPGSILKTSSGKIQRRACRDAYLAGRLEPLDASVLADESGSVMEEGSLRTQLLSLAPEEQRLRLAFYLREVLGRVLALSPWQVDLDCTAAALGLDSLGVAQLRHQLETQLGTVVPAADLLQGMRLGSLLERMLAQLQEVQEPSQVTADFSSEPPEFALSRGQRALWFLHELQPQSAAYNVTFAADILSPLDAVHFARAVQAVVERHEALRTRVVGVAGEPRHQEMRGSEADFACLDAADWDERQLTREIERVCEAPFDLAAGRLLRVRLYSHSTGRHTLLIVAHHIVMDLWSMEIVLEDLITAYTAFQAQRTPGWPRTARPFREYVARQEQFLQSKAARLQLQYWAGRLSGSQPALELPYDHPKKTATGTRGGCLRKAIDPRMARQIRHLAKLQGVTPYVLLLTLFLAFLRRYTGQSDISVGSSVVSRDSAGFANTVGYLANQVVIRLAIDVEMSFAQLLTSVQGECQQAWANQEVPFATLVEALRPERTNSRSPLFDVMFGVLRPSRLRELGRLATQLPGETVELAGLELASRALERRAAQFDLMLTVIDADEASLVACWEFDAELFEADSIDRMHRSWLTMAEAVLENPSQPLARLPLLAAAERHQVLVAWNDTARPVARQLCMHELFEAQVERTPRQPAVSDEAQTWSYAELNRRANQLAHRLQSLGAGAGALVGICLHRHNALLESMLAVMKAGAAYVPLDPLQPAERLTRMLADARPLILLTQSSLAERFSGTQQPVLCLDTGRPENAGYSVENPSRPVRPADLAYVMYTSGSTGGPKGVMITHAGLANYLEWAVGAYDVAGGCGAAVHSSVGFDATITGLFCPLLVGGKVMLLPEAHEIEALSTILRGSGLFSLIKLTPAHLEILKSYFPPGSPPVATRAFVVGGEVLAPATVKYWRTHSPLTRIINEYGPTETVVGCCAHEVTPADELASTVPIGRPIANVRMYLLDACSQPVPVGVIGEIHIGGAGVAQGYLNRPGLTAEHFIADPFSPEPQARMYRSGDRGRWRADGEIQYLGRCDSQVNLRGFRVELGEVKSALLELPEVSEAVITVHPGPGGNKQLVAHVVPGKSLAVTREATLRAALGRRLPQYMVPTRWIFLEKLPLTAHGKVDHRALEGAVVSNAGEMTGTRIPPQTPVQQVVAQVWREVLGVTDVGIHDNFFDVGGHSVLAAQVHQRLVERLDDRLTLLALYQHPTIHALEQHLTHHPTANGSVLAATQDRARRRREQLDHRRGRP